MNRHSLLYWKQKFCIWNAKRLSNFISVWPKYTKQYCHQNRNSYTYTLHAGCGYITTAERTIVPLESATKWLRIAMCSAVFGTNIYCRVCIALGPIINHKLCSFAISGNDLRRLTTTAGGMRLKTARRRASNERWPLSAWVSLGSPVLSRARRPRHNVTFEVCISGQAPHPSALQQPQRQPSTLSNVKRLFIRHAHRSNQSAQQSPSHPVERYIFHDMTALRVLHLYWCYAGVVWLSD